MLWIVLLQSTPFVTDKKLWLSSKPTSDFSNTDKSKEHYCYCTWTWPSITSKACLACAVEVSSRICTSCIFIAIMDPGAAFIDIWIPRKDTGTQLTISKPFDKNHPTVDLRSPSSLNKHDCLSKALTYECGQVQKKYSHILNESLCFWWIVR